MKILEYTEKQEDININAVIESALFTSRSLELKTRKKLESISWREQFKLRKIHV